jgi:Domain of unknown function (DUF4410)
MVRNTIGKLFGALLCFGLAACGQTGIREAVITPEKNLPRPARILVYDFAVSEREVTEYQGIMRQQPTIKDPAERERQIAIDVKNALAGEVVDGLRALGFVVERASRGTSAVGNELLIDGQFFTVNEGNPVRRLVGTGTSIVEAQAQAYQGSDKKKLLDFATHSDSGMHNSDVARMAAASGDQVVRYLSEFFAQQGWIRADQVRKARISY